MVVEAILCTIQAKMIYSCSEEDDKGGMEGDRGHSHQHKAHEEGGSVEAAQRAGARGANGIDIFQPYPSWNLFGGV